MCLRTPSEAAYQIEGGDLASAGLCAWAAVSEALGNDPEWQAIVLRAPELLAGPASQSLLNEVS